MTSKTLPNFDLDGQLLRVNAYNHNLLLSIIPNLWELKSSDVLVSRPSSHGKLMVQIVTHQDGEMILKLVHYNTNFFGQVVRNPVMTLNAVKRESDNKIESLCVFTYRDPFVPNASTLDDGSISILKMIFINEFLGRWLLQLRAENHQLFLQKA